MTLIQKSRLAGFQANVRVRGVTVFTNNDEELKVIVNDAPTLSEMTTEAKAKEPIYCRLTAEAECIESPYSVKVFSEIVNRGKAGEKNIRDFTVIRFEGKSGDSVTWTWFCESTRRPEVSK